MNYNEIKELRIDEMIWTTFIFLSILNITGDEYKRDYCLNKNTNSESLSKSIFLFTVFISLIVYAYIAHKKYKIFKFNKENNLDNTIAKRRLLASILVVIASILLLYCQYEETNPTNPSIL